MSRPGVKIPRNIFVLWMIKAGDLVQFLMRLLNDRLLTYPVLQSYLRLAFTDLPKAQNLEDIKATDSENGPGAQVGEQAYRP